MTTSKQAAAAVAGRILLAVFLASAAATTIADFASRSDALADRGFPVSPVLVGVAATIEAAGALCLLIGVATRPVAFALAVWMGVAMILRLGLASSLEGLTPAALCGEAGRDLAVIGGLLLLVAHGPGEWSYDARRQPRTSLGDSNVLG